ncbi:uncharacterized protein LOC118434086 [Folsomia candida]|nr:uncharacterized protein LOC118434086 [Folsomia candida]XP_035702757.1 uncharacterized protein LOC118434086 [Folsomia candida]
MKWLDAYMNYGSKDELTQFGLVLKTLTNLEELHLYLDRRDNRSMDWYHDSKGIVVPNLKKLRIYYKSDVAWSTSEFIDYFLLNSTVFPALEDIELPPYSVLRKDGIQRRMTDMVVSSLSHWEPPFRPGIHRYMKRLRLLYTNVEILINQWGSRGLEGLGFYDSFRWTQVSRDEIGAVLRSHSNFLKTFSLPINLLREEEFVGLNFPRMENLTELEVEFIMGKVEIDEVDRWEFPEINVSELFPNLKKLRVKVTFVSEANTQIVAAIGDIFIPLGEGYRNVSVTKLELVNPYVSRTERKEWRDGICKLFPKLEKFVGAEAKVVDEEDDGVYDANISGRF